MCRQMSDDYRRKLTPVFGYLRELVREAGEEAEALWSRLSRLITHETPIEEWPEELRKLHDEAEHRRFEAEGTLPPPVPGRDVPLPLKDALARLVEAVRRGKPEEE